MKPNHSKQKYMHDKNIRKIQSRSYAHATDTKVARKGKPLPLTGPRGGLLGHPALRIGNDRGGSGVRKEEEGT